MSTTAARCRMRAHVMAAIRRFFADQGFIEVDTPVAIGAPAPELHIEAPEVWLATPEGPQRRFLQTSPELAMKRLLALGLERIYQIAAVFRDGDLSPQHRPEFRLLEWYRRDAPWTALLDDCEALLGACARAVHGSLTIPYQGQVIDLTPPFARLSVDAAFRQHAGFAIVDALDPAVLRQRLQAAGIHHQPDDPWDDLFHRAFVGVVEPALKARLRPLFLTHYPAPLAALARRDPADPRVAERVELYVGGLELANGFGELTDPVEQRQRFETERQLRRQAGRRDYPLDERFLAALHRMPPAAGIALGVDRLLLLLADAAELDAVAAIPWSEA